MIQQQMILQRIYSQFIDFNCTGRNSPIDKCGHVPKIIYTITGKKETYNPIKVLQKFQSKYEIH